MRLDRDTFLLMLAFIPVGYVLYAFFMFRTTGAWPLGIALSLPLPTTSVPSFLKPFDTIPEPFKEWIESGRQHWQVVLPSVIAGGVAGFFVIGVIVDTVRVSAAHVSRSRNGSHREAPVEEGVLGEPDGTP